MRSLAEYIKKYSDISDIEENNKDRTKLWVCNNSWEADYETFLKKNSLEESEENYRLYIKESFYPRHYGGMVEEIIGIDPYEQYQYYNCINEVLLHSWDAHALVDRILPLFKYNPQVKFVNSKHQTTQFDIILDKEISIDELDKLYKFKDFWQALRLYNYYVRMLKQDHNTNQTIITIDPYKPKEVNDYVYNICKGVVYHVTSKESWERIKKGEIVPKGKNYRADGLYEYRDKRSYFIASTNIKDIKFELESISRLKGISDPVYIKIDLNKTSNKPKFRLDSSGTGKKIFTEEPIAGFCCSKIIL